MYPSEEILRFKLEYAYLQFVINGTLIIEEFIKQKAIENYFSHLDKVD